MYSFLKENAKIKELRLKMAEINFKLENAAAQLVRLEDLEKENS